MRRYLAIWVGLVLLAAGTLLASFVLHGSTSLIVALGFATAKAALVLWFFMHLGRESASSRYAFLAGVFFVVLLVSFALGDVLLRPRLPIRPPIASSIQKPE